MMIKTAGTATGRAVGARVPLIDGIEKVIGKADFTQVETRVLTM